MPRCRDLGITIGLLPSGRTGSIVDVPGVGVGHATVWRDEADPPAGRGVARTGVTVVDPGGNLWRSPIPAGGAVLNGAGECTGFLAAQEWGRLETPIFLTSTMQVGRVFDAACQLLLAEEPGIGVQDVVIPVVAECDDSFLSDPRRMQVEPADVAAALAQARRSGAASTAGTGQAPPEGGVGAGTGMSCLGFKGGIGSASRIVVADLAASPGQDRDFTLGVLAMTNFGERDRLTVAGVPVGRLLPPDGPAGGRTARHPGAPPAGSCIVVLLTDAPLDAAACRRVARRAGLGLARTGSVATHGSGEIFLAAATGLRATRDAAAAGAPISGSALNGFFAAAVEATEEAVLNSLLQAVTVTGRAGNTSPGLPADEVARLLGRHRGSG